MSILDKKLAKLLSNDSFVRWLNGTASKEEQEKWDKWQQSHSLHKEFKRRARLLYRIPMTQKKGTDRNSELLRLGSRIDRHKKNTDHYHNARGYPFLAAAIVVLLIGVVSFISFTYQFDDNDLQNEPLTTIKVGNGGSKVFSLNDGSEIYLNANSTLRYKAGEFGKRDVEVWLEGEAYFSITHNPNGEERIFTVHTPDGDVQELGTKFNINTHFSGTSVVLEEGSIKLILKGHDKKVRKELIMNPGQKAVLDSSRYLIGMEEVDPSLYTAWIDEKMKFDRTPLKEIIKTIEANYGVTIAVSDASLLNKKVSGSVGNPNLIVLLEGLEHSLNVSFEQENENKFLITK